MDGMTNRAMVSPCLPDAANQSPPEQADPDPDTIKMFVGQIPRTMSEEELLKMFQAYGPIYQLNILRDKGSGVSRGCCFITYYKRKDSLAAQNATHNIKILPGMHHPIQMKPADTENRNERKLFIGMVNKRLDEDDIKKMFAKYGPIEECTVLRDDNGISRGCAFVTFLSRSVAATAIESMHHSQTMEGCSSPLVVKFADTQKDKENKKLQQLQSTLWTLSGPTPAISSLVGTPLTADSGVLTGLSSGQLTPQMSPPSQPVSLLPQTQLTQLLLPYQDLLTSHSQTAAVLNSQSQAAAVLNSQSQAAAAVQYTTTPHQLAVTSTAAAQQPGLNQFPTAAQHQPITSLAGYSLTGPGADQLTQSLQSYGVTYAPSLTPTGYTRPTLLQNIQLSQLQSLQQHQQAQHIQSLQGSTGLQGLSPLSGLEHLLLPSPPGSLVVSSAASNMSQGSAVTTQQPDYKTILSSNPALASKLPLLNGDRNLETSLLAPENSLLAREALLSRDPILLTARESRSPECRTEKHHLQVPQGANLFIYHLPPEFKDCDLVETFQAFGTIVSAKVFVDKQTNLSKCFGFVSFTTTESAQRAIQAMNGFQIGTKRLKVQVKKARETIKPY